MEGVVADIRPDKAVDTAVDSKVADWAGNRVADNWEGSWGSWDCIVVGEEGTVGFLDKGFPFRIHCTGNRRYILEVGIVGVGDNSWKCWNWGTARCKVGNSGEDKIESSVVVEASSASS